MAEASVTFTVGVETVTVVLPVDLSSGGIPLVGDVSGTFGDCFIAGDVNLTGDLIVEGLLTGVDTFTLTGNGFQILVQNGGQVDLAGVEKTAWVVWDGLVVGWQVGDRLAVAPTAVGVYVPSEMTWSGSWATMTRPANSSDVTLVDGSVAKPEVVNLSQSIVLQNLRRALHAHDGAGVQIFRWVKALNCGTTGVLGDYPIHFHLNGETSRGSVIEGVVVEGGKNHAFVPHGSHGITFLGCAAVNTIDDAYWWDAPTGIHHTANNTNDNLYDHCLALGGTASNAGIAVRLTGFQLLAGSNNRCLNCVAACIQGGNQSSGFHWPEHSGGNDGGAAWQFDDCVGHNNAAMGLFNWQNDAVYSHLFNRFTSYRNGRGGIISGAYRNDAKFRNCTSTQDGLGPNPFSKAAVFAFAKSERADAILYEDYLTDHRLLIAHAPVPLIKGDVVARRATWTGVTVQAAETDISWRFEDCGLVPADFTIVSLGPLSVLKIIEGGAETHRWQSGVWS